MEKALVEHVLGSDDYTPAATTYIGLWTAALSDSSTGSTAGEVSGGSYARVGLTNDQTSWSEATAGALSNAIEVDFGAATGNWGTITHGAIIDASSNGNILYWFDLTASKTVNDGDSATFPVGDIDVSEA